MFHSNVFDEIKFSAFLKRVFFFEISILFKDFAIIDKRGFFSKKYIPKKQKKNDYIDGEFEDKDE